MQSSTRPRQVGLALVTVLLTFLVLGPAQALGQEPTEEQLQLGARLYGENCAVCHGPSGEGRIGATLAQDWPSIRPDLRVKTVIQEGVPGSLMPAWSEQHGGPLTEEEIDALTLYILSWETGGARLPAPPPAVTPPPPITPVPGVEGDPNQGAALYAANCAVCHGPRGEGRVGAPLAQDWPSIRPDLRVKTVIEQGVPGSPMPAWSQTHGGPLTDEEINDIVAYTLSWEPAPQAEVMPTPTLAPSIFSGPLGVLVLAVVLVALALVAIIGALSRRS